MAGEAIRFTLFIPGDQLAQLDRVLVGGADAVQNWIPAWERIATMVEDGAVEQFRTQGARGGTPWAPLSETYASRKMRRFPGAPMLIATGRGYGAVVNRYDSNHVRDLRPFEMRVGADDRAVPYMKFHQSGTRSSFGRDERLSSGESFQATRIIEHYTGHRGLGMPRRRPMMLTSQDKVAALRAMHEHVHAALAAREGIGGRYADAAEARDSS